MSTLLTRDQFRETVFERDNHNCIVCGCDAIDAHHIMERRLWSDGGYYIENGASLCGACHLDAEHTRISPDKLYDILSIKRILPPHLYDDYRYTKWGDIQNENGTRIPGELFFDESVQKALKGHLLSYVLKFKYPRTYHLPNSASKTDDDRTLKDFSNFQGHCIVITEKMDGENTTGYWDGHIHARSLETESHPSRSWIKNYLPQKLFSLPKGWRICGENLYAKHSIHYTKLRSYFYLFSIWNEKNECLSWEETVEWAMLLDLQLVNQMYYGCYDESKFVGYVPWTGSGGELEGYVVRNSRKFAYKDFRHNVGKYVRANHVQTTHNWKFQKMVKNEIHIS